MLRFQQDGIVFVSQQVSINLWRIVRNIGHLLKSMIEIWSKGRGHGPPGRMDSRVGSQLLRFFVSRVRS